MIGEGEEDECIVKRSRALYCTRLSLVSYPLASLSGETELRF